MDRAKNVLNLINRFRNSVHDLTARYSSHQELLDGDFGPEKLKRKRDSKYWGNGIFRLHPGEEPSFSLWIDILNKEKVDIWLDFANLNDTDLTRIDLRRAFIRDAKLQRAKLNDAKLRNTDLYQADLDEAELREANLENANLIQAKLTRSVMRHTNLKNAFLLGADLRGADLRGAIGLTNEQIKETIISKDTQFDPEFDAIKAEMLNKIKIEGAKVLNELTM